VPKNPPDHSLERNTGGEEVSYFTPRIIIFFDGTNKGALGISPRAFLFARLIVGLSSQH
jgi:hypothetical protein